MPGQTLAGKAALADGTSIDSVLRIEATTGLTTPRTGLALVRSTPGGQMGDNFAIRLDFSLRDAGLQDNVNTRMIVGHKVGVDNTGTFKLQTAIAGVLADRIFIDDSGAVIIPSTLAVGQALTAPIMLATDTFISPYDPRAFGAVCDGVTNDNAAIRACLAVHKRIFLPKNTRWVIDPTVALPNDFWITGEDASVSIECRAGGASGGAVTGVFPMGARSGIETVTLTDVSGDPPTPRTAFQRSMFNQMSIPIGYGTAGFLSTTSIITGPAGLDNPGYTVGATGGGGAFYCSMTSVSGGAAATGFDCDFRTNEPEANAIRIWHQVTSFAGDFITIAGERQGSGTFTGNFLYFLNNGVSMFRVVHDGSVMIGSPSGGLASPPAQSSSMGPGTLNIDGNIYKDGTAYNNPHYVFEHAFTGRIERFANREGAAEYTGLRPIGEVEGFVRENSEFPLLHAIPNRGLFDGGDAVLATLEEGYLYLFDHERRLLELERRLQKGV